jgi:hypothetical protein
MRAWVGEARTGMIQALRLVWLAGAQLESLRLDDMVRTMRMRGIGGVRAMSWAHGKDPVLPSCRRSNPASDDVCWTVFWQAQGSLNLHSKA